MKKKSSTATAATTPLDSIRKSTGYPGARMMFGLPFLITGCAYLLIGGWVVISNASHILNTSEFNSANFFSFVAGAACLVAGLFALGITFLADAIFDIADCSIRNDSRETMRISKEAYEAYRKNQAAGIPLE